MKPLRKIVGYALVAAPFVGAFLFGAITVGLATGIVAFVVAATTTTLGVLLILD